MRCGDDANAMAGAVKQLHVPLSSARAPSIQPKHQRQLAVHGDHNRFSHYKLLLGQVLCNYHRRGRTLHVLAAKASPIDDNNLKVAADDDDEGVSLGTMKLPLDTDIPRFESLLFQWANSLFQGANLPLPVPLKVDKIKGGVRLGFITIGDGKTEVNVYIDCLVFPATEGSAPIFRAIRNGSMKDQAPPGEPRIMRSLLQALQRSAEIARV